MTSLTYSLHYPPFLQVVYSHTEKVGTTKVNPKPDDGIEDAEDDEDEFNIDDI